jgi:hypothetical protein
MDELYTIRMAWEHAAFIASFGHKVSTATRDGHVYSAYPEHFEHWLELGCPGLHEEEVDAYLKANPL